MRRSCLPLLLVAAVFGCKREIAYERVELPGFTVELPRTRSHGDLVGTLAERRYATGKVQRESSRKPVHVAVVSWHVGPISTAEELEGIMGVVGQAIAQKEHAATKLLEPAHAIKVGDRDAMRVKMDLGPIPMVMVETTCGARAVQFMIGAEAPEPIVDHVLGSFVCNPDPAQEALLTAGAAPIGLDDPTGWNALDNDGVFTIFNGTVTVMFWPANDVSSLGEIDLLKAMAGGMPDSFGELTSTSNETVTRYGRTRRIAHGQLASDGETFAVTATAWPCTTGPAILGFALTSADDHRTVARDGAIDILLRARCLNPGETPPSFPPVPADDPPAK